MNLTITDELEVAVLKLAYAGGKKNEDRPLWRLVAQDKIPGFARAAKAALWGDEEDPQFQNAIQQLNRLNDVFDLGYLAGRLRLPAEF